MPDGEKEGYPDPLKSGVMPRVEIKQPPPESLPEMPESEGATSGMAPIVTEDEDPAADRDEDTAAGT